MVKFWRKKNQGNAFTHFFNFWVEQERQVGQRRHDIRADIR